MSMINYTSSNKVESIKALNLREECIKAGLNINWSLKRSSLNASRCTDLLERRYRQLWMERVGWWHLEREHKHNKAQHKLRCWRSRQGMEGHNPNCYSPEVCQEHRWITSKIILRVRPRKSIRELFPSYKKPRINSQDSSLKEILKEKKILHFDQGKRTTATWLISYLTSNDSPNSMCWKVPIKPYPLTLKTLMNWPLKRRKLYNFQKNNSSFLSFKVIMNSNLSNKEKQRIRWFFRWDKVHQEQCPVLKIEISKWRILICQSLLHRSLKWKSRKSRELDLILRQGIQIFCLKDQNGVFPILMVNLN